ncbi:MAG: FAD-dependent oxidoreductase, partial [Candidatus Dormiibacterota bacterium]
MSADDADVVVVGAGPSGAATALLLARAGHPTIVLDRARFPRDKACGEGLMPSGVAVLRRLGLLDSLLATGAPTLHSVSYRVRGHPVTATAAFPAPPGGGPA